MVVRYAAREAQLQWQALFSRIRRDHCIVPTSLLIYLGRGYAFAHRNAQSLPTFQTTYMVSYPSSPLRVRNKQWLFQRFLP